MLCIEIRQPGLEIRAKLWKEMACSEGVVLTATDASELACSVPAAPGILRNALRATRLVNGNSKTALQVASGIARVVNGGCMPLPEENTSFHYDPALVQADCDLAALAKKVTKGDTPFSPTLLLSGPPGCGKSAYARYLAAQMGLPILIKRASDLIGPFVGESEARIASAFAEARDTRAFLVFDEADSLLADRRGAQRSWEVSQVNEMLTWMESHPLPFACTTNLPDQLDHASLRRFLFKARFGYLRTDQTELAFQSFFGVTAPVELYRLENLTPADFAVVRRRATFLDSPPNANAWVAMLATECTGREGSRRIGFVA
jgi:transitional endoplasmic reticulum ATPase